MNDQLFRLLERAVQVSPNDWEMRAQLLESLLVAGQSARALDILRAAPIVPEAEPARLLQARVEMADAPSDAIQTLEGILTRNRACAQAYLLLARVYRRLPNARPSTTWAAWRKSLSGCG